MLSVFDASYKFLIEHRGKKTQVPLWKSVAKEIMAMVAARPLMVARLARPWVRKVYMTDASYMGGGLLETTATLTEIRAEARLVTPKGWHIDMDFYDDALADDGDDSDGEYELERRVLPRDERVHPALAIGHSCLRLLPSVCGLSQTGRLGGQHNTTRMEMVVYVIVISLDKLIDADLDLTNDEIKEKLANLASKGRAHSGRGRGSTRRTKGHPHCGQGDILGCGRACQPTTSGK